MKFEFNQDETWKPMYVTAKMGETVLAVTRHNIHD